MVRRTRKWTGEREAPCTRPFCCGDESSWGEVYPSSAIESWQVLKAIDYESVLSPFAPPWSDRGVSYGKGSVRGVSSRHRRESGLDLFSKPQTRRVVKNEPDELLAFVQEGPEGALETHLRRICRMLLAGVTRSGIAADLSVSAPVANEWIKHARWAAHVFSGGAG